MDSLTQAVLGGAVGGAVLGRPLGRKAVLLGAALATLPDLDVLIDYGDAVSNFTQHRGFSHSLIVLTSLAVLLTPLARRWRRDISATRWFIYFSLVLLTHPLLDAFTTYGTQLWWPFAGPISWNAVFIIDPLYTLPLLVPVALMLWRPVFHLTLLAGLLISSLYLAWGVAAQQWMLQRVEPLLVEHQWQGAPLLIQPMPFNTLLWRITVLADDQQVEIITGVLDPDPQPVAQRLPRDMDALALAQQFDATGQLETFTGGFIGAYRHQHDGVPQLVVKDIRLGLPGAYPFHFVVAEQHDEQWQAVSPYQLDRPMINPQAWPALWQRILGRKPVLCLGSFTLADTLKQCHSNDAG